MTALLTKIFNWLDLGHVNTYYILVYCPTRLKQFLFFVVNRETTNQVRTGKRCTIFTQAGYGRASRSAPEGHDLPILVGSFFRSCWQL